MKVNGSAEISDNINQINLFIIIKFVYASMVAKITQPLAKDILYRDRLFQKLDSSIQFPLTWITAPAGAGKTMLVSSYSESRNLPCLWFQVDSGDADLATFFHYLGLAGKELAEQKNQTFPLFTPEFSPAGFSRNFFGQLFEALPQNTVLVFDNMQEVPDDAMLYDALLHGLNRIAGSIRVILVSRIDPPIVMARLRANRQVSLLDWQDLRLHFDEFNCIIDMRGFSGMQKDILQQLYKKTDGWVAGLHLMLEHTQINSLQPYVVGESDPEQIFDYFAGEIFQYVDEDIQHSLMCSSFLPKMNESMARELTGHEQMGEILANRTGQNFFISRRHGTRPDCTPIYEYHPLFRDFLQSRARLKFRADQLRSIQCSAARILAADGQVESAMKLLLEAAHWQEAVKLISKNAVGFLSEGRGRLIKQWINTLPDEIVDNSPWLLYWLGLSILPYSPGEARVYFINAFMVFKEHGDFQGIFLSWSDLVDSIAYEYGDFSQLDQWIEEIQQLLSIHSTTLAATPELEAKVACSMFMALMYRRPEHPDFGYWEEYVWRLAVDGADPRLRMAIGNQLIFYYMWWNASRSRVETLVNALQPLADTPGLPALVRLTWYLISSGYHWSRMENEEAIIAARKGLEFADETGIHLWDMFLCVQAVIGALSIWDLESASKYLKKMPELFDPKRHLDSSIFYYMAGWHAYLKNDLEAAYEYAKLSVEQADKSGFYYFQAISRIGLTRILFYKGRERQVNNLIKEILAEGKRIRSKSVLQLAWFEAAEIACFLDDDNTALHAMQNFFDQLKLTGFFGQVFISTSTLETILVKALEHDMETELVQRMIALHDIIPESSPHHLENWPWQIKIYTFGSFQLVINGQPYQPKRAPGKVLALLKVLLALGERQIPEFRVTEELWPDKDGDVQYQTLKTTIHRLRQLLLSQDAVIHANHKISLHTGYCWIDAWCFERQLDGIELQGNPDDADEETIRAIEKSCQLYKGEFLPGEDSPYSLATQRRLKEKYLQASEFLERH
ncbi:MAG: hypothetical protein ACH255_13555 [Candidatus Thiodiazotropha sp.]